MNQAEHCKPDLPALWQETSQEAVMLHDEVQWEQDVGIACTCALWLRGVLELVVNWFWTGTGQLV